MREPLRLALVTAVWGRPEVTRACLTHHSALSLPGVALEVHAAVSPDDPAPCDEVPGVVYREIANQPLSDKWNALVESLRDSRPDIVVQVDSDSLLSTGYLEAVARNLAGGACCLVSATEFTALDTETGEAMRVRTSRPGPGRALSAAALDRCGWRPWPDGYRRMLNGAMDRHLATKDIKRWVYIDPAPGVEVVEVKGDWPNVWGGYEALKPFRVAKNADVDLVDLCDRFPALLSLAGEVA